MKAIQRNSGAAGMRCLSAHEIATLMVLLQAPVDAMAATPDVAALREAGLAQVVDAGQGKVSLAASPDSTRRGALFSRRRPPSILGTQNGNPAVAESRCTTRNSPAPRAAW
jgi:hypothetical protein